MRWQAELLSMESYVGLHLALSVESVGDFSCLLVLRAIMIEGSIIYEQLFRERLLDEQLMSTMLNSTPVAVQDF